MVKPKDILEAAKANPAGVSFHNVLRLVLSIGYQLKRRKGSHAVYGRQGFPSIHLQPITSWSRLLKSLRSLVPNKAFRYRIIIQWSEEDQAYIAQVPALGSGCAADGPTPQKAVKEIQIVAGMFLESMAEDGDPIPPPDKSFEAMR